MQFRVRGEALQLLRVVEAGGKTQRELVGRVPRDATVLPAELAKRMSAEECAEFDRFVKHSANLGSLRLQVKAWDLLDTAAAATTYLAKCEDEDARNTLAAQINETIVLLRNALRGVKGEGG